MHVEGAHFFPNRYLGGGFSLPLGGLGGEGEGAELPQPQPQPHGGRDPPRFCDPYRRSGLLPLWGSRIGGVQVTIFDRGVQSNVVRGVRGLGHGRVARERGHSCQLPGALVSGYCSTPPRCRGALVSAAKGAFFIAGFDRRRAMVRIFDSIIAWCDVGPPDSDTLVSAFVCYSSGSGIVTVGLQLDSLF